MKENKKIVKAKNNRGNIENPKLIETCKYYRIDFDEEQYHSAIHDATKTLEILNKEYRGQATFKPYFAILSSRTKGNNMPRIPSFYSVYCQLYLDREENVVLSAFDSQTRRVK